MMDKADKLDLKQSTRRPFKSRDLAFSREVNRQGQRNRAIRTVNEVIFCSISDNIFEGEITIIIVKIQV